MAQIQEELTSALSCPPSGMFCSQYPVLPSAVTASVKAVPPASRLPPPNTWPANATCSQRETRPPEGESQDIPTCGPLHPKYTLGAAAWEEGAQT